jgi:hypothetical protein
MEKNNKIGLNSFPDLLKVNQPLSPDPLLPGEKRENAEYKCFKFGTRETEVSVLAPLQGGVGVKLGF